MCQGVGATLLVLLGFTYWDAFILSTKIHVLSLVYLVIMLLAYAWISCLYYLPCVGLTLQGLKKLVLRAF